MSSPAQTGEGDVRCEVATLLRQRANLLDDQMLPENAPTVRELLALAMQVDSGNVPEHEDVAVLNREVARLRERIRELEGAGPDVPPEVLRASTPGGLNSGDGLDDGFRWEVVGDSHVLSPPDSAPRFSARVRPYSWDPERWVWRVYAPGGETVAHGHQCGSLDRCKAAAEAVLRIEVSA